MIATLGPTVLQPSQDHVDCHSKFQSGGEMANATVYKRSSTGSSPVRLLQTLGTVNTTARKGTTREVGFFAGFRNCSAPDKYASALKEDKPFLYNGWGKGVGASS